MQEHICLNKIQKGTMVNYEKILFNKALEIFSEVFGNIFWNHNFIIQYDNLDPFLH